MLDLWLFCYTSFLRIKGAHMAFGIREPTELPLGCVTWGVFPLTSLCLHFLSSSGTSTAESSGLQ